MSGTLTLEILTPERKHAIEDITMMTIQLEDGSIGILPGHAPLLAQTISAPLIYKTTAGDAEEQIVLKAGILLVRNDKVTIFIAGVQTTAHQLPVRLMEEGIAQLAAMDEPNGEK